MQRRHVRPHVILIWQISLTVDPGTTLGSDFWCHSKENVLNIQFFCSITPLFSILKFGLWLSVCFSVVCGGFSCLFSHIYNFFPSSQPHCLVYKISLFPGLSSHSPSFFCSTLDRLDHHGVLGCLLIGLDLLFLDSTSSSFLIYFSFLLEHNLRKLPKKQHESSPHVLISTLGLL